MKPRIYNRRMELVGILQNASSIAYKRTHNDLFTASFELPYDDPKTSLCDTHFVVDVFDGEESKGKYRILDEPDTDITGDGQFVKYSCEHVIAFLLNDVIDGYLELGGTGFTTRQVIERILNMQTVRRWQLGTCDFNYQFQYSWENTNLLDALFSVPTCFADAYHWTYNTDTYPWTINLVRQDSDRSCEIRRKRNMQQIKREKDSSALCTRLYCKGSGEGINQLSIKDVNGGRGYIDADTIGIYDVVCSHYIDLTVTDADTLLAKGRAVLEEIKHPRYTYTAKAADLSKITGVAWDRFDEGKFVRVVDDEKGIDLDAMIISVEKTDIDGDPLDIDITISNKASDVSSAIEDLSKRAAITAQYSQGATNLYAQQYADNADAEHPAVMRFFVPSECSKINKVLLSWDLSAFRAYETGASAGGATVTTTDGGGGSESTSSAGGGSTVTSTAGGGSERTSSAGGGETVTEEQRVVSTMFAAGPPLDSAEGFTMEYTNLSPDADTGGASGKTTGVMIGDSYAYSTGENGAHTHTISGHTHTGPSHNHGMGHFHYGPSHTHTIASHNHTGPSHTHTGPSHKHSFSDTYALAWGHTHTVTSAGISNGYTGAVRNYAQKTISISGDTGNAGTGSTGSAGTGATGGKSLTTDAAGTGMTGNAVTSAGNSRIYTSDAGTGDTGSTSLTTNSNGAHSHSMGHVHGLNGHTHTMPNHRHYMRHFHMVSGTVTIPAMTITIPSHRHSVSIDNHSHDVSISDHTHTVTIPDHTHNVTLEDHTHEIIHGIFEGGTANSASIVVDNTPIPSSAVESDEMDIVAYLAKDSNGKITRGTWHTIEIVPDSLTRIEANLFVQTFVTSYSGGNY